MQADYVLVGGGLQNGLVALAVAAHQPAARIAMIERGEAPGGNHTWCFHAGDLAPAMQAWIDPLVVARWERPPTPAPPGSRTPGAVRIQIAAVISFAVFAAEIQWGLSLLLLTLTTAVIAVALRLVSTDRAVTADLQRS